MRAINLNSKKIIRIAAFLLLLISFTFSVSFAVEVLTKENGLISNQATNIRVEDDNIWFIAETFGISSLNKESGEFTTYGSDSKLVAGTIGSAVKAFDKIWVGTSLGVHSMDSKGNIETITEIEVPHPRKPGVVIKKTFDKSERVWFKGGKLWVCSMGVRGGLYTFNGSNWDEVSVGKQTFNYVNDLEVFNNEEWFATSAMGIYIRNVKKGSWRFISPGKDKLVIAQVPRGAMSAIMELDGVIWAASSGGIYEIQPQEEGKVEVTVHDSKTTDGAIKNNLFTSLVATESGDIYAGTTSVLYMYSNGSWSEVQLTGEDGNPIRVNRVYSLAADGDTVYVGLSTGVVKIN